MLRSPTLNLKGSVEALGAYKKINQGR